MPGSSRPDAGATAAADRPAATKLVEQDLEAPDIFQQSEAGLWDGRPSLGGVWVAHPDVSDPERVIIRNTANGKSVIGALFRRERDNPGPRFQVSSDAAASLGLLAGAPTNLNVTALRRAEPAPEAPAADPAPEAAQLAEAEPVATETLAPAADAASYVTETAAAAIDRAETAPDAAGTEVAAASPATPAAEPARRGLFGGLFRQKPTEPLNAVGATAPTVTAAGTVLETPQIETRAIAPQQASAQAPSRPASALDKPYVQIGIFSVETNANNTAAAMRQSGIVPTVFEQQSQGKTFWRVVVGPATSRSDRSALLRKVKGLGFEDAYTVSR